MKVKGMVLVEVERRSTYYLLKFFVQRKYNLGVELDYWYPEDVPDCSSLEKLANCISRAKEMKLKWVRVVEGEEHSKEILVINNFSLQLYNFYGDFVQFNTGQISNIFAKIKQMIIQLIETIKSYEFYIESKYYTNIRSRYEITQYNIDHIEIQIQIRNAVDNFINFIKNLVNNINSELETVKSETLKQLDSLL